MEKKKNILIINGYGYTDYQGKLEKDMIEESNTCEGRLTETLVQTGIETLSPFYNVKTTAVDKKIVVAEEQALIEWADLIIWHFPVYWYNIPAAAKNYFDLVFEVSIFHDPIKALDLTIPYGSTHKDWNKKYLFALTWNSPIEAFEKGGFFEGITSDDIFLGSHKTMEYCGFKKLQSFELYSVLRNTDINAFINAYKNHLSTIVLDKI